MLCMLIINVCNINNIYTVVEDTSFKVPLSFNALVSCLTLCNSVSPVCAARVQCTELR